MLRQCRVCTSEVDDTQADSLQAYDEFVETGICFDCQDISLEDDFVDHEWDYDENDELLAQQELEDFENFYGPTEVYDYVDDAEYPW